MSSILTNLMFGNINQNGELEDDSLLDQVRIFKCSDSHRINQNTTVSVCGETFMLAISSVIIRL